MKTKGTVILLAAFMTVLSCGPARLRRVPEAKQAAITLPSRMSDNIPEVRDSTHCDTLVVRNVDGRDMFVMRAVRDDDGTMVANQVLEAATVTARFRNVAERHGKVDIEFQITVPKELQSGRWQLRYTPTLYIAGDSVKLDRILITGAGYRKRQLRGYQQYRRFLDRIISDSTLFIDKGALEIFLKRNIPQIYAFRNDTSFVSDEQFNSAFGVSRKEAVDHYTDKWAKGRNEKRKNMKAAKYRQFVKVPIGLSGTRLDTVMLSGAGDYVYNYVQTIPAKPKLKKVDVVLDGEIYEMESRVFDIGRSAPLTFYISSVSAFVDDSPRYVTQILERRAEAGASYDISFRTGRSEVEPSLGSNAGKLAEIKSNLAALLENRTFDLDSITVTASASPEGALQSNLTLSRRRGEAISRYFESYLRRVMDSLRRDQGVVVDLSGEKPVRAVQGRMDRSEIKFITGAVGEDWMKLDELVTDDPELTDSDREEYAVMRGIADFDAREAEMRRCQWYSHIRDDLYPKLRTVKFVFAMHRKGMIKDTVHTTVLDSVYMAGVQAIKDRDYDLAIELLRPYGDFNAAVAYCAKDFNHSALAILRDLPKTAQVNYMLALLYSRFGDEKAAVTHFLRSCAGDSRFIHRGNLDPEINLLIRKYKLDF